MAAFSYLMLKPDGNNEMVFQSVMKILTLLEPLSLDHFRIRFTYQQAYDFYPKNDAWKEKYGDLLLKAKEQHGWKYPIPKIHGKPREIAAGDHVLHRMAEFLSSGDCRVIVFSLWE